MKKLDQDHPKKGNTRPFRSRFFPISDNKNTPSPMQAQLFLNVYNPKGKSTSENLSKKEIKLIFQKSKHDQLTLCWPICMDSSIYKDPKKFTQVLEATLNSFKAALPSPFGKSIHLILVDTGALHRHNIAKASLMASQPQEYQDLEDPFEAPDTPPKNQNWQYLQNLEHIDFKPITETNEAYRAAGLASSLELINSLPINKIAETIGCQITISPWGNVDTAKKNVNALFALPTDADINTKNSNLNKFTNMLKRFYLSCETFKNEIGQILFTQIKKDDKKFGRNFNYHFSVKCTLNTIFEEMAHLMLIRLSVGHNIDAVIQPEILLNRRNSPPNRSLFHGEILNTWVERLTLKYSKSRNLPLPTKSPYLYITAGVLDTENQKRPLNSPNTEIKSPVPTYPRKSSLEQTQHSPDRYSPTSLQLRSTLLARVNAYFQATGGRKGCRDSFDFELADLLKEHEHKVARIFYTPDKKNTPSPIQAQLFLNVYNPSGKSTSENLKETVINRFIGKPKTDQLTLYWPICIDSSIYKDPNKFTQVLEATLNSFKAALPSPYGKPIHLILGDTGALHRHNIAKASLMASQPQDYQDLEDSFEAPDTPPEYQDWQYAQNLAHIDFEPITETNEAYRAAGLASGLELINSLQIKKIADTIGCEITILPWENVDTAKNVNALFALPTDADLNTKNPNLNKFAKMLKRFYLSCETFRDEIDQILFTQIKKDDKKFRRNFNYHLSVKCTLNYIFEEMAHMMLIRLTVGHIIDAVIQPEILLNPRNSSPNRSLFHGEILNTWVERLTLKYSKSRNLPLPTNDRYLYITVGVSDTENQKRPLNSPNPESKASVPTSQRKSSLEQAQNSPERNSPTFPQQKSTHLVMSHTLFQEVGGIKGCRDSFDYKFANLLIKEAHKAVTAKHNQEKSPSIPLKKTPTPITTALQFQLQSSDEYENFSVSISTPDRGPK